MSVAPRVVGRYQLFDEIASGGLATVHFGRMTGTAGFARTVAIKRLHPHLAKMPGVSAALIDEARLAARIRHPNVATTLDIVSAGDEMLVVMEYVDGVTIAQLLRQCEGHRLPIDVAVSVVAGALYGLHAAHEAKTELGDPLGIVHRDVSPQNVIVGRDGVARVVDFGVAKAANRSQTTEDGQVKGKRSYMAPEQIRGNAVDRRTDVYAAAVVAWEAIAGKRLFEADHPAQIMNAVLEGDVPPLESVREDVSSELAAVVMRGLSIDPAARFPDARAMGVALEKAARAANTREVGEFVEAVAAETLKERAAIMAAIEREPMPETRPISGLHGPLSTRDGASAATRQSAPNEVATETAVETVTGPRPAASRARGVILAIAVVAALALGVVLRRFVVTTAAVPSTAASTAPSASSASALLSASSVSAFPTAGAEASASPPTPAPPSASLATPATTSQEAPPVTGTPRRPAGAGNTAPSPAKNCNPPFTVDADGTRHWKKGC